MLDDVKLLEDLDKDGMLDLIYGLPDQFEKAAEAAKKVVKGPWFEHIHHVVIAGVGGSAIGGNLLKMITQDIAPIPIAVNRDYTLPAYVDEKTLVIAASYSGNTEETLSAYQDAQKRGAQILAITTGGLLKEKALAQEVPVIRIPAGLPPRAALGYSFSPLLVVVERLGIVPGKGKDLPSVLETLKELRDILGPHNPEAKNPAKQLARKLWGKLPVIYGATGITDVVAERWKGQINENGKHPAYFNAFPELNHNEIMGYEGNPDLLRNLELVILRSPNEKERIRKRVEITRELIEGLVSGLTEITPQGATALSQMFYLIMYGDYVSCYLSFLNEKDPSTIGLIDALKESLQ